MKEIITASLKIKFAQEIIQYQSLILMALVTYWIAARWDAIKQRFSPEGMGPTLFWLITAFSVFFGVVCAVDWGTEYVLLAATIALGVALAMFDSAISICFFIALLFMRPWEIIKDNDYFGVLPKLTMSLCIANLLLGYARKKTVTLRWNRTATFLFAYAGWCYLTTMKSSNPGLYQTIFFDNFFKCTFLFTLILNMMDSVEEINLVLWTMVITMFGVGFVSIYQTAETAEALQHVLTEKVRLMGFGAFSNSNDIGALMVMIFPFAFVPLVQKGSKLFTRVLSGTVVAMVFECVRLSQSRGAMLGVAAILGFVALSTIKNRKAAIALAIVGALGVGAVAKVSGGRSEADLNESSEIRMVYIQTGLMMGLKNPVFGVGFEGYGDNFNAYQTKAVADTIGHRTAHNSWILALAETGFLGLFLYAAVFFSALVSSWRFVGQRPEFFLAIVGYGIAMTFLSHTYFIYPYLMYGLQGVAARLYGEEREAEAEKALAKLSPVTVIP